MGETVGSRLDKQAGTQSDEPIGTHLDGPVKLWPCERVGNLPDESSGGHSDGPIVDRLDESVGSLPGESVGKQSEGSAGSCSDELLGTRLEELGHKQPGLLRTFAEVMDVSDVARRRRRLRRHLAVLRVAVIVLLTIAACVAAYPSVMQWHTSREQAATTEASAKRVAGWPYPHAEEELAAARAYNAYLATTGQSILGEAADPFAESSDGGSQAKGEDSIADKDSRYQRLLDVGDGVMGAIRVPKVSIDLPIYHGTGERTLAKGAGHLYGTSLPVGGANSHSVITGHRGLVEAAMFTRLDELEAGDFMYLDVMGETLGYEVDRITVIEPTDTSQLTIVPGEDRLTLMTCTPYGINTQRLLVSGHRVSIPDPAPDPADLHDPRAIALWATAITLVVGLLSLALIRRLRHPHPIPPRSRHVASAAPPHSASFPVTSPRSRYAASSRSRHAAL